MTFGMPYLLETATVEDACRLCRELGLSFVELTAHFPACQAEGLRAEELLRLKAGYDIDFTFHVEEECDPFAFQGRIRDAWLDALRQTMALAVAVGMPVINMHLPHGVYITLPGERVCLYARYREGYLRAAEELRGLCESCLRGSNVRIALENTDGFQPHEREAIDLLLASPRFGLTLDIGHSHTAGNCDESFYRELDSKLIHMHGHDAQGSRCHLALGDGDIDLAERFAWAERRCARVVLETKTVAALRTSVARLPQWTGEN